MGGWAWAPRRTQPGSPGGMSCPEAHQAPSPGADARGQAPVELRAELPGGREGGSGWARVRAPRPPRPGSRTQPGTFATASPARPARRRASAPHLWRAASTCSLFSGVSVTTTPSMFFAAFSTAKPFSPEATATTYQAPRSWTEEDRGEARPPDPEAPCPPGSPGAPGAGQPPSSLWRPCPGGAPILLPAPGPASPATRPGPWALRPEPAGPPAQPSCSQCAPRPRTPVIWLSRCGRPVTTRRPASLLAPGQITKRGGS